MKVYQVYHCNTVLHTFSTRDKAQFIRDWIDAEQEDIVRDNKTFNSDVLAWAQRHGSKELFVLEVEVEE